jgi:hypothetical protein
VNSVRCKAVPTETPPGHNEEKSIIVLRSQRYVLDEWAHDHLDDGGKHVICDVTHVHVQLDLPYPTAGMVELCQLAQLPATNPIGVFEPTL